MKRQADAWRKGRAAAALGLALLLAGCGGGSKFSLLEQADRDYTRGDWPAAIEHYKAYLDGIKGLDIPEEDKVRILGGNMKALFNA